MVPSRMTMILLVRHVSLTHPISPMISVCKMWLYRLRIWNPKVQLPCVFLSMSSFTSFTHSTGSTMPNSSTACHIARLAYSFAHCPWAADDHTPCCSRSTRRPAPTHLPRYGRHRPRQACGSHSPWPWCGRCSQNCLRKRPCPVTEACTLHTKNQGSSPGLDSTNCLPCAQGGRFSIPWKSSVTHTPT